MAKKISDEIKYEAIEQMKDGKTDKEISKVLGVSRSTLRSWRKKAGLPPSSGGKKRYTTDQLNDVIDLIREINTISEISRQTGVATKKIRELRKEEIRNGNPLPHFKKGKGISQKYSDEELIELAFLNRGSGFDRFVKFLGVEDNFVMDLFLDLLEYSGGEEDPLSWLQDPSNHVVVSELEYKQITGRKYTPKGMGRTTGKRARGESKGMHVKIQLPPQEFHWGSFSPKIKWEHSKPHELNIPVKAWINKRISEKGYLRFDEDSADFSDHTGAGRSKGSFSKWMKKNNLTYDAANQYWTK